MALTATDRNYHREGLTSSTRTADSLLVVETLRGHIRLEHGLEWTDIDADLHRGRNSKQIYEFGLPQWRSRVAAILVVSRAAKEDTFEAPLTIDRIVRLSRELLAPDAKRVARSLDSLR